MCLLTALRVGAILAFLHAQHLYPSPLGSCSYGMPWYVKQSSGCLDGNDANDKASDTFTLSVCFSTGGDDTAESYCWAAISDLVVAAAQNSLSVFSNTVVMDRGGLDGLVDFLTSSKPTYPTRPNR